MADYLIDTNVLIKILKGDFHVSEFIAPLSCAIDTTVYVELIQGAKNKAEIETIEVALTKYNLIHFNEDISKQTISLIRRYSKSHGLLFGDAVIAATCIENDLELITFNVKDFYFIKELVVSELPL